MGLQSATLCANSPEPLAAVLVPAIGGQRRAHYRTRAHARLAATLEELGASKHKRAASANRQKDVKVEALPEVPPEVARTIRRVVCGEAWGGEEATRSAPFAKLPPDKQTNYLSDELHVGARVLNVSERERMEAVYKEVARSAGLADEKSKNFKWSNVTVPWSEFARRLRGKLPSAHIQRFAIYFNFSKTRIRLTGFMERMGLLLSCATEKRLKVCFALLDVNGDAILGPRDVFAVLPREACEEEPEVEPLSANYEAGLVGVTFSAAGPIGLDFSDVEVSALEVVSVVPGSPAEQQGVRPGDCLARVNDVGVESLSPQDVRLMLIKQARPLQLHIQRKEKLRAAGNLLSLQVFERLRKALKSREHITTRLQITIVSARGLRNADVAAGGKSDPYCVCEVEGRPHVRYQTRVVNDCLDPEWNDERELTNYMAGDSLKFSIRDKDPGSKFDEILGQVTLPASRFLHSRFEQEVSLTNTGKGNKATLRLKIVCLGEGGIAFEEFAARFEQQELPFYPALTEELTGTSTVNMSALQSPRYLGKVRVTVVSASGLRSTDTGSKSDPYCVCEIPGRPGARFQTQVIGDTIDPVWNKRGELDCFKGDAIKFSVFDKDPNSLHHNDLLGQVIMPGWQLNAQEFDGDLDLADAGRGFSPKLRVKVAMPSTPTPHASPSETIAASRAGVELKDRDATSAKEHEQELQELQRSPHFGAPDVGWYARSFEALCGPDCRLRRGALAAAATRLLGLPSRLLAGRLFELMDGQGSGEVALRTWVVFLDRFFGNVWEQGQQRISLSFALYDLDGDGIITVQDAVRLATEVERLAGMLGEPAGGPSMPICEEMRLLYGKVADATDTCGGHSMTLEPFLFNQLLPSPVIYDVLRDGLEQLGRVRTPPPPPTPPPFNLMEAIAGAWNTISGDAHFQGLRIEAEGRFHCDQARLQDGLVRVVSLAERKISLKRRRREAGDYLFEVDEDGLHMTGHCPQTSASWTLSKVETN